MPTAGDIYYFASKGGSASKPPVVLIHGAGEDHRFWHVKQRRLPGYRVFAPDLPGHGKSKGLGRQRVAAYAEAIRDWLDDIGIYRAVFVGHSMGGAIAQRLALEHPDQTLGLGLVATGARLRVRPDLLEKLSTPNTFKGALDLIIANYFAAGASSELKDSVREQLAANRPSVLLCDYTASDHFDVMERLGEIKVPVAVISGKEDTFTPVKYAEYFAEHLPNAELTLVPDAGHMVALEQPEAVAGALEAFLQKVPY
jgi:pimeloyl-ACP methyl ester carboxylesterase